MATRRSTIFSAQFLPDDVLSLIFGYLIPSGDLRKLISCSAHLQLVCRKWRNVIHFHYSLWKALFDKESFTRPSTGSYLNAAVDQYFEGQFMFFCRDCLSPLTRPVMLFDGNAKRRVFDRGGAPGHPYPESEEQFEFMRARRHLFLPTNTRMCLDCTNYAPRDSDLSEEDDCVAFYLPHGTFVNVAQDKQLPDNGCCGPTGNYGPNYRCVGGCRGSDRDATFLTYHGDCNEATKMFHVPLSRVWTVRVSRVCPSLLRLALDLEAFVTKHSDPWPWTIPRYGRVLWFSGTLPLGPPPDALEAERKAYEELSQSIWNLVEPEHVEELIEDSYNKCRRIDPLRKSGEATLEDEEVVALSFAEDHMPTVPEGGRGSNGKHKRVHTTKHIRLHSLQQRH